MEDRASSGGLFEGRYTNLVTQEELDTEDPLYPDQEKQRVTMSEMTLGSSVDHRRRFAVGLAALAVFLLALNIGLGVYYNKLAWDSPVMDIGSEVGKLRETYNRVVQEKQEAQKQLTNTRRDLQITRWELEHQTRTNRDFQNQIDRLQTEIADLQSHMPMIEDGCRHCFPGWTYWNSMCYFFAFSDSLAKRSWQNARQFCNKYGGDLVTVDDRAKQRQMMALINQYQDQSRSFPQNGFWIGLNDMTHEGLWRWTNGTSLTDGYWRPGEPNNQNNEDCAAMYPSPNPFQTWNDAPCSFSLKWICEMTSRSTG